MFLFNEEFSSTQFYSNGFNYSGLSIQEVDNSTNMNCISLNTGSDQVLDRSLSIYQVVKPELYHSSTSSDVWISGNIQSKLPHMVFNHIHFSPQKKALALNRTP